MIFSILTGTLILTLTILFIFRKDLTKTTSEQARTVHISSHLLEDLDLFEDQDSDDSYDILIIDYWNPSYSLPDWNTRQWFFQSQLQSFALLAPS